MIVGIAQGRKRTARISIRPRNFSFSSSAMHMPSTSLIATATPV